MMNRRRFISIAATIAAGTAFARQESLLRWHGVAMGADVSIDLGRASGRDGNAALAAAVDTIRRMEGLFSIYDPQSALSRLNYHGRIIPEPEFLRLIQLVNVAHALTGGLFDPTVQSLVMARLQGKTPTAAERTRVGWNFVEFDAGEIRFCTPGMAMTLNGIAQGFATDRVTEVLASHGFTQTLVNIGEYRVGDRATTIGIGGAAGNIMSIEDLRQAAIATSVPGSFMLNDRSSHIMNPKNPDASPIWASASVVASTATMADAFSTALVLANGTTLAESLVRGSAKAIILENAAGEISRI